MMNQKKSPDCFSYRHLLIIPLLVGLTFIHIPLTAQQKTGATSLSADFSEADALDNTPVMKGEKVFGIVNASTRMEDLHAMKKEFAKRGVTIEYSGINFTAEGKLSRIQFKLVQWNREVREITLDNQGKALDEKLVAFFFHNEAERSAKIGLEKQFPRGSFGKDETDRMVKNTAGVIVVQEKEQEDNVWIKGQLSLMKQKS